MIDKRMDKARSPKARAAAAWLVALAIVFGVCVVWVDMMRSGVDPIDAAAWVDMMRPELTPAAS